MMSGPTDDARAGELVAQELETVRSLTQTVESHARAIARLRVEATEMRLDITTLRRALESSRRIGAAIGIIMATLKLSEGRAFEILGYASQNGNRKLRDIADDVVLTGALPTPRPEVE